VVGAAAPAIEVNDTATVEHAHATHVVRFAMKSPEKSSRRRPPLRRSQRNPDTPAYQIPATRVIRQISETPGPKPRRLKAYKQTRSDQVARDPASHKTRHIPKTR